MFKSLRRARTVRAPFPPAWLAVLETRVEAYGRLNADDRATLRARIQVFLSEKIFEGCGGLAVTDEMRVVVAAQACRLELGRRPTYFPHCRTIYLYPGAFVSTLTETLPGGVVHAYDAVRVGESWHRGGVVLAWDAVLAASLGFTPGRNVVLHEFAHQLDGVNGAVDGVPALPNARAYEAWQHGMRSAYLSLVRDASWGIPPIDEYAATSPAEFFAVTTELYLENADALSAHYPDVPRLLGEYYGAPPRSPRLSQLN